MTVGNARVLSSWGVWGPLVLDALRAGASLRTAAGLAGVTGQAVNNVLKVALLNPEHEAHEWAVAIRREQSRQVAETESWHREAREAGNAPAMQWWLARMDRETYGDDAAKAPPVADAVEDLPDASPDDVMRAIKGAP